MITIGIKKGDSTASINREKTISKKRFTKEYIRLHFLVKIKPGLNMLKIGQQFIQQAYYSCLICIGSKQMLQFGDNFIQLLPAPARRIFYDAQGLKFVHIQLLAVGIKFFIQLLSGSFALEKIYGITA